MKVLVFLVKKRVPVSLALVLVDSVVLFLLDLDVELLLSSKLNVLLSYCPVDLAP
jgi:hypothetical protein